MAGSKEAECQVAIKYQGISFHDIPYNYIQTNHIE